MISSFLKRSCSSSHLNSNINESNNFKSYISNNYNGGNLNRSETKLAYNDDTFSVEEVADDCIFQVTVKKVYNKNLDRNNNNINNNNNNNNNPYGTYKPLNNGFFSYVNNTDNQSSITATSASDGLVYTRVKIKQLKYATLEKFVEKLVNEQTGELDKNLCDIFLSTYRTFSDCLTVIRIIKRRYEQIMPASLEMTEDIRVQCLKSYRQIIKTWLNNYIEDFNEQPPFAYTNLKELKRVAKEIMAQDEPDILNFINSKYQYLESLNTNKDVNNYISTNLNIADKPPIATIVKKNSAHSKSNSTSNFFTLNPQHYQKNHSIIEKPRIHINNKPYVKNSMENLTNLINTNDDFISIDSIYFAEQLTFIDKSLFQKVFAHHYLGSIWSTRNKKVAKHNISSSISIPLNSSGHNLDSTTIIKTSIPVISDKFASDRAFIDQFNCVSFVVQAKVLDKPELKPVERAKIIKKWIEIAQMCKNYKNFNSLNAIVQGLNTKCVSRLTKTWNEVPA
jgi:ral guanine nucleotide dissociation stimulator-like 1